MKKLLGISLVAMLAVSPLTANAALPSVSVPGSEITTPAITANTHVATTSYVQGAHRDAVNTAIAYVNAENTRATEVEGSLSNLSNDFTAAEKTNLVSAINAAMSKATAAESNSTNAEDASFTADANSNISATTIGDAINEIAADYQAADSAINDSIGDVSDLDTTATDLVGAVNEVKGTADSAATAAAAAQSAVNNASLTVYTTWGDETNGKTNINPLTGAEIVAQP